MNIPMSWIREFADVEVADREYAAKMTMLGQKVERYYREADAISGVVTAEIRSVRAHPNADKLFVCTVNISDREVEVVTGADNIGAGDVVPLALSGAVLFGGKTIASGSIRGVLSEGMFCSLSELGLSAGDYPEMSADYVMTLPPGTPAGTDISDILGFNDTVFEFEITPNRPDCMSVAGLSRETAAVFGSEFKFNVPGPPKGSGDISEHLLVENKTANCLRYSAAVVKNVNVRPSPQWMRERLRKCGLRPINNIVDITNYVMLEYGQPMHAFDMKHVSGQKIIIRQAVDGETIVALDKTEHVLDSSDMVIADSHKPTAIAGIMGGQFSGIYDDTDTVVFESACFDALSVRFTSKKLGLRTDSSALFEKGLDANNTYPALCRALQLVEQIGAGQPVGGLIDLYESLPAPKQLPLDPDAINAHLGTSIPSGFMSDALLRLGFSVDDGLRVTAPTFRKDVEGMADLAEEVARMYGYDNIPSTIVSGVASARPSTRQRFERALKELSVSSGFYEALTLSFMSAKSLDKILVPEDGGLRNAVRISNPFGEETSLMRTSLLPSLMEALARNFNARANSAALFELSAVYLPADDEDSLPDERKLLTIAGYGSLDFYRLKGVIERFASFAGIKELVFERQKGNGEYHPGRSATASSKKRVLAVFGELNPEIADNYGIRARCSAAEIDVEALFELRGPETQYRPLPRFPAVMRDLAVVCDEDLLSAEVEKVILNVGGRRVESLRAFDVYTGAGVPAGKKSVAYSLTLRDEDKTLTDAEAEDIMSRILIELETIGVVLRT